MVLIIFFISLAFVFILSTFIFFYLDRCRRFRRELLIMGVPSAKFSGFKGYNIKYLKDLIYEKETLLTEQCYVASSDFLNN